MIRLSICIPTFNRLESLKLCLRSIEKSIIASGLCEEIELCVSDNGSSDGTAEFLKSYNPQFRFSKNINNKNLGFGLNIIKVTSMARGDYLWVIGSDDLLLHDSVSRLFIIIKKYVECDFIYVNAYDCHISNFSDDMLARRNLDQNSQVLKYSNFDRSCTLPFFGLIKGSISNDFLGGIFLSVFRRERWMNSLHVLNYVTLQAEPFSSFEVTFPHVNVYAEAFSKSQAYFNKVPLVISLSGIREWNCMGPFVMSVRLVEALDVYRKAGLPLLSYLRQKNYSLRNFGPNILKILFSINGASGKKFILHGGFPYSSLVYPNSYLSFFYSIVRKLKNI